MGPKGVSAPSGSVPETPYWLYCVVSCGPPGRPVPPWAPVPLAPLVAEAPWPPGCTPTDWACWTAAPPTDCGVAPSLAWRAAQPRLVGRTRPALTCSSSPCQYWGGALQVGVPMPEGVSERPKRLAM